MSLRLRVLFVGGLALIGVIVVSYSILQTIMLNGFARVEEREMRKHTARTLNALSVDLAQLESAAGDWAPWDDTYNFIEDSNPEYIKSNLADSAFAGLDLNLMVFVHSSARIVFGKAYDLHSSQEIPVPASLQPHLARDSFLLNHPDIQSVKTGIVSLPEGPLLVASMPILTSEKQGPIRGTLIFGRFLDSAEIARLAETTQLALTLHSWDDTQAPTDFQSARAALSDQTPVIVRPLNGQTMAGYALLKDIYGKPALILGVETDRDIHQQGQASVNYMMWALVVIGIGCYATVFLFLERLILFRLAHLSQDVGRIGIGGDPARRVSVAGNDELSGLAREINRMLEAIEQSQSALRASEERFRSLVEHSSDLILVLNPDATIRYASPAVKWMLGYEPAQVQTHSVLEYIHEDDRATAADALNHRLAHPGASDYQMELRVRHRDGSRRALQVIGTNLVQNPAVAGIVVNCREVTERKCAEDELRQLKEFNESIVQNIAEGIIVENADGFFTFVNPAAARLLGYTPDELIGKHWTVVVPPDQQAIVQAADERRTQRQVDRYEAQLVCKDGTRRLVLIAGTPRFENGEFAGSLAVFTDITERQRVEKALRESEKRYRDLFENANDLIYTHDLAGRFTSINRAAERVSGYTRDEALTMNISQVVAPEDLESIRRVLAPESLGEGPLIHELEIITKDSRRVPLELSTRLIFQEGKPVGVQGVARDITERKRAEAALKEYSERLEQMVEERTRALRDAQDQLLRQERLTMLGQLAGGIGHELRNPLSAIKNAVYLLNLSLPSPDPDVQETLQILSQQVDASNRIITSLLDLARPQPPYRRETDLRETIDAALGQITIPENITVSRRFDATFPPLSVDPAQLEIALGNLIRNAVQAMPGGGRLTIDARSFGKEISIAFSDTGVGIAPDVLDKLFQPMFSTKTRGIGLGLALCKLLVEGHGGRIEVTSQVGKGTTFVVYLPLPQEARGE